MIAITFWSFLGLRLRQPSEGKCAIPCYYRAYASHSKGARQPADADE